MSIPPDPTISLNQRTISFVMGLFALLGIIYTGVSTINNYSSRINNLETRNVELLSEVSRLNKKIDDLSDKIVTLTIALNRVDDRTTKK